MDEEKNDMDELAAFTGSGLSRRDFLKICGMVAATLGLDATFIPKIARALSPEKKTPVVWLHFAECTGCTESFLRTAYTTNTGSKLYVGDLILSALSIEYHETIMAASGAGAHKSLADAVSAYAGEFICICEGAIPTAKNGIYGMINNKTMLQIARDVCPKAKAVISYGTCSSFGGLPAAAGNVTGAKGVHTALGGFPTINISGCPPNPLNLVGAIVYYLLNGTFPPLDRNGRPLLRGKDTLNHSQYAFQKFNHEYCPRRVNTTNCLRGFGCRGPETYNNCSNADGMFNEGTSWPVNVDAPCYGCSEPEFWDKGKFFNYDGVIGWNNGIKNY